MQKIPFGITTLLVFLAGVLVAPLPPLLADEAVILKDSSKLIGESLSFLKKFKLKTRNQHKVFKLILSQAIEEMSGRDLETMTAFGRISDDVLLTDPKLTLRLLDIAHQVSVNCHKKLLSLERRTLVWFNDCGSFNTCVVH
jgi:hypothetical protein